MRRAIDRGATLTQQLLSFARQQPLTVANHNPNDLIEGFETVLRRAGTPGIQFEFALAPDLDTISVDAARFEAALLNLVVNARDATASEGLVAISTGNVALREGEVGQLPAGSTYVPACATAAAACPQRSWHARSSRSSRPRTSAKGTGLGLSQVYGFIAQSGGDVTLESVPGQGTAVHIYLPVNTRTAGAAAARDDADSESVLIVEDEADLMAAASELFRSMGYDVITASNARDALDILERKQDIDILFSDVMMPNGMNGVELARGCTPTLSGHENDPGLRLCLAHTNGATQRHEGVSVRPQAVPDGRPCKETAQRLTNQTAPLCGDRFFWFDDCLPSALAGVRSKSLALRE